MPRSRKAFSNLLALLLITGLVLVPQTTVLADDEFVQYDAPILMRLGYKKNKEDHEARVPAVAGNKLSPTKGLPQLKWELKPGDTLTAGKRPGDRLVALYTGTNTKNRVLLCIVHIRYFRNKAGHWQPHYLINQQHLAVRAGGRWAPITSVRGNPTLIVLLGRSTPNAFGFYPSLTMGLSTRAMQIDSWFVR